LIVFGVCHMGMGCVYRYIEISRKESHIADSK